MKKDSDIYENNPFETKRGSEEWIKMVENEKGTNCDKEIYPFLEKWISDICPKTVVDIGCGQGICSQYLGSSDVEYIGIDPSSRLIDRAKQLYTQNNKKFIEGNIYKLSLDNNSVDACFSISTWFHLSNLNLASKELSRVIKNSGNFLIITANPNSYDIWESFFDISKKDKNMFVGVNKILLNPNDDPNNYKFAQISQNTFYTHTLDEIEKALEKNDLKIDSVEEFGILPVTSNKKIFLKITGHK
jgi:ubiquinone/menaquinone biosynthesis C-methylase UbiE